MIRSLFLIALTLALFAGDTRPAARAAFLNLDFESATIIPSPPSPPTTVSLAAALPHWTGFLGTNQVAWVYHNTLSLSGAGITLYGPDNPVANAMHGHYFLQLKAGNDPFGSSSWVDAGIAQTGLVPAQAKSIRLWNVNPYVLVLGVSFAGQDIPMVKLGSVPTSSYPVYVWGGDVSVFAGLSGELRIHGDSFLDYVQFSNEPIPEPSALALAGIGAVLLALRQRNSRPS